jgi:hypothetical protein
MYSTSNVSDGLTTRQGSRGIKRNSGVAYRGTMLYVLYVLLCIVVFFFLSASEEQNLSSKATDCHGLGRN